MSQFLLESDPDYPKVYNVKHSRERINFTWQDIFEFASKIASGTLEINLPSWNLAIAKLFGTDLERWLSSGQKGNLPFLNLITIINMGGFINSDGIIFLTHEALKVNTQKSGVQEVRVVPDGDKIVRQGSPETTLYDLGLAWAGNAQNILPGIVNALTNYAQVRVVTPRINAITHAGGIYVGAETLVLGLIGSHQVSDQEKD